jgi:hypothetical protein
MEGIRSRGVSCARDSGSYQRLENERESALGKECDKVRNVAGILGVCERAQTNIACPRKGHGRSGAQTGLGTPQVTVTSVKKKLPHLTS